jgi:hypothetical protein
MALAFGPEGLISRFAGRGSQERGATDNHEFERARFLSMGR